MEFELLTSAQLHLRAMRKIAGEFIEHCWKTIQTVIWKLSVHRSVTAALHFNPILIFAIYSKMCQSSVNYMRKEQ